MANIGKLMLEMVVVGIGLVNMGLLIGYIMDFVRNGIVVFWPPHAASMVVGTFTAGALFHFLCEWTGVNAWYVQQYTPLLI